MKEKCSNSNCNTISHLHNLRLTLMLEGIIVGVFSGLLIVFYRIVLEKAEVLRSHILNLDLEKNKLIPLWLLILIVSAYFVGLLIKKEPLISGSGIPQVEGVLAGKINLNWLSLVVSKFVGGVISIGAGLSLGREGPSIQLGATLAQGLGKILKRAKIEDKYLITSGASAGLAAAFNAPLAGVMFALEEVHRHFSPLILLSAMSASLTADFISKQFFGLKPVFNFQGITVLPLKSYGYIVVLGIITGLCGVIYNYVLLKTQDLYSKQKWLPERFRPMIPFLMAGILAFTMPQVLGGGHSLVNAISESSLGTKILLVIFLVKFIFSMISYGSGAPGGIFFPLLVLGALTGAIYGNFLVDFFRLDPKYINNFVILAMAGYFTAIVRAPITGSILITEMTGSFSHLLSLSIISLISYVIADLMKSEPIYESLLERLLKNRGKNEEIEDNKEKNILEISVCLNSRIDGKAIKEINLPANCLLVSIRRGEKEIIPNGNTIINSGDLLYVFVDEDKAAEIKEELLEISSYI